MDSNSEVKKVKKDVLEEAQGPDEEEQAEVTIVEEVNLPKIKKRKRVSNKKMSDDDEYFSDYFYEQIQPKTEEHGLSYQEHLR